MFTKMLCVDPRPLEIITAIQGIVWGLWLLLPYNTFLSSPVYSIMLVLAGDVVWGAAFLILGSSQLVLAHIGTPRTRGMIAAITLFAWTFVDLGLWLSGSYSAAGVTYLTFVLVSAWQVAALSIRDRTNCRDR